MPENVETRELSHKDCMAANSRSTGPQQQNTDDHNCPFDNAERSTSADRRLVDVDDQRRQLFYVQQFIRYCEQYVSPQN